MGGMVRAVGVGGVGVDLSAGRRCRVDFGVMIRGLQFSLVSIRVCAAQLGRKCGLTTIVIFWPGLRGEGASVSRLDDRS